MEGASQMKTLLVTFLFFVTMWVSMAPGIFNQSLHAEERSPAASPGKDNVLDFEADLIQGERRRPDLFVQLGSEQQSMESVLYARKDFNDFHRVDKLWRPSFVESPAQAPAPQRK